MSATEHAQAAAPAEPVDPATLLAELEEDVRRKRASGELPPGLERELDLVFARFAPVQAIDGDFEQVLTKAEELAFIDPLAPFSSTMPGVTLLKRVVRKLIIWVIRHVTQQVGAFGNTVIRALQILGARVDHLEAALPSAVAGPRSGAVEPLRDVAHWSTELARLLAATSGRVAHAECGDGALVAALVASGLDAYGVEPGEAAALAAVGRGVEVRNDEIDLHLERLPDAALGALVLSGCVDRLPRTALLALADAALAKVQPGGAIVIVTTDPRVWEAERPAFEIDLGPGRPLRAETWAHLLSERGCATEVLVGPRPEGLTPVPPAGRGSDAASAVLNANLARLNEVLFPPATACVVARRPR